MGLARGGVVTEACRKRVPAQAGGRAGGGHLARRRAGVPGGVRFFPVPSIHVPSLLVPSSTCLFVSGSYHTLSSSFNCCVSSFQTTLGSSVGCHLIMGLLWACHLTYLSLGCLFLLAMWAVQ